MFICLFYVRKNWEENFWVRMKSVQMTKIWWCKGSSWAWILYFFSDDEKLFNLNLDEEKKQQDSSDRQGCIIKLCDSFMPKWQLEAEKNRSGSWERKYFDLIKSSTLSYFNMPQIVHNTIVKLFCKIFLIISRSS